MRVRFALAAVVVVVLTATTACSGDDPAATTDPTTAGLLTTVSTSAAAPTETTKVPLMIDGARNLDAIATPVYQSGDWLSAGEGGIWITDGNTIVRLDPKTGKQVATVRVPQGPCEASTVGLGYVWTAVCGVPGMVRIDPKTNKVTGLAKLPAGTSLDSEGSVGAGAGSAWMVADGAKCSRCEVARIDADTLKVTALIDVEEGAAAVRFGFGNVWVTNPERSIVQKIDPGTETVVQTAHVGSEPRFFAAGEGGVWTLNQGDGTVSRVDPGSGDVTSVKAEVYGDGGDLAVGGGWVWARGSDTLLTQIDPSTNEVVNRYGPSVGSGAAIVGYGAVWVSAHDVSTVWRLPLSKAS